MSRRAEPGRGRRSWSGLGAGVWGALAVVYLVWGSTYFFIKVAIESIPPFLMASVRFLAAGGLLYGWSIGKGAAREDRPTPRQWLSALLIGGALLLGGNGGVVWAEDLGVPSGIVALLVATAPLWMASIEWAIFGVRLGWQAVAGLALGFGGLILLLGAPSGGENGLFGAVVVVLAALCWASGSLYARRARMPQRPLVATAMEMLAGGALLAIVAAATGELGQVHLARVTMASWLALSYLTVFGSLVAFTAYTWLLRKTRITVASTYAYVNPMIAVLLGALFLDERVKGLTLVAGAVIVLAVALIVSAREAGSTFPPKAGREVVAATPAPNSTEVTHGRRHPRRRREGH